MKYRLSRMFAIAIAANLLLTTLALASTPYNPFKIKVIDSTTGEGIPLVHLRTNHRIHLWTDSQGYATFYEPGLMDQEVYFHAKHSDFVKPADWFGNEGRSFNITQGSYGEIQMDPMTSQTSGFWPLNDGSGTNVRDLFHNNNATLSSSSIWMQNGGVTYTAGDHALQFDGINDYMTITRKVQQSFTISFFFKTSQTGPTGTQWYHGAGLIDGNVSGTNNDFGLSLLGDKLCFGIGNPDTSIISTSPVNNNQWHHVAVTRNADTGEIALYVDMYKQASTIASNRNDLTTPSTLIAGRLRTGTNFYNGIMDDLTIFNSAISHQEIYYLALKAFDPSIKKINPFVIKIVDMDTGRGVPLVKLTSDCGPEFWTDSAGVVSIYEPYMLNRDIHFDVFSHGYYAPESGGFTTNSSQGNSVEIPIRRQNIAERMYRITGGGIYNHSTLAGLPIPLANPNLSGKVLGQDTVAMTKYKGKFHWLWGDTDRPAYPLGNFKTSGATSPLPENGGLMPDEGIDLTYFVNGDGFSKSMYPESSASLVWMNMMNTVDDNGQERMIASYAFLNGSATVYEGGVAIFNDNKEEWQHLVTYQDNHHLQPSGYSYKHTDGYIYCCAPYPTIRYRATLASVSNPTTYQGFTCLKPGTKMNGAATQVERDTKGKLVWAWKTNTSSLSDNSWNTLVDNGIVSSNEYWNRMFDPRSEYVAQNGAAVSYSPYRNKWIMTFQQIYGHSFLGEIWYAEADNIEGPWRNAIKVITHENYTFYNHHQQPEYSQYDPRYLYFDGTYTASYTSADPTPRYNYNQVMYRIDFDNPAITGFYSNIARGSLLMEWWLDIEGTSIASLTSNTRFPDNPNGSGRPLTFEIPSNIANDYGTRIRGYLYPPLDGNYTFWISGDDNCDLYLSTNGDPANKSRIAYVPTYSGHRNFDNYPQQKSASIYLEAGKKYYIESLHKEGGGGDHLAVAWAGPDFSREIIQGKFVSPWFQGTYGDFTNDNTINIIDLDNFSNVWLDNNCPATAGYDLNGDCIVNLYEFAELANNWLQGD